MSNNWSVDFDAGYLRQAIRTAIRDLESDWERGREWALQTLRDAYDRTDRPVNRVAPSIDPDRPF